MATRQQPTSQHVTPAPEKPTYSDSSGAIFSMYIDRAQTFDKENVDNWDGQANGILLFTGLFSSTVASFIAISYQNLQQDPNVTTQSLLAQISQQLSTSTTGGTTSAASPSVQTSFTPAASVVFINSVWFLSLVLSLTCALMATLLQQWARRYLQMVQRNHAPHVRAHIREYFARGARRFGISWLVDVLPFLLLISILLFFAGLVVFAFRANHVVAYFTLSIVAFCLLSYLTLTLTPLFSHDCPYHTPLTSLLWFCAHKALVFLFSTTHLCAKHLHENWGAVSGAVVEFQNLQKNRVKSFSEGMISNLENSAKRISMDIYSSALGWTLSQLDEDHELENFAAGIPGLYESGALTTSNDPDDPHPTIHTVLSVLPGPSSFNEPLPWSIIGLAQRATASDLSETLRRQRIKACLRALYYIPGAIRDMLAPYAAGKHYCLVILPLLNSPESLEIIEELWDTPRDDVALSVRCAATVIAAFMITPPRRTLDIFLEDVPFIWDHDAGKEFLSKRLRVGGGPGANDSAVPSANDNVVYEEDESVFTGASVGDADLHSDNARLQNLGRFLADIGNGITYMGMPWLTSDLASDSTQPIHQERRALFDARNTEQYRAGSGISKQHGDRASPAFVRAAQQDLITLTLEILTRESIVGPAPLQFDALHRAHTELRQLAGAQMLSETLEESLPPILTQFSDRSSPRSLGASLPRPLTQILRQTLTPLQTQSRRSSRAQTMAHSVVRSLGRSLERSRTRSLAQFLAQSLTPPRPQWLTPSSSPSLPQFVSQSLPHLLTQSLPQSLLLGPVPSPVHAQVMLEEMKRTQGQAGDGIEVATRAPQAVVEGIGVRLQIEDTPTVHDGPSTTPIYQAVSAGPSRLSLLSLSLPSVQRVAAPGDHGTSDSGGAHV
ncbi:hypothetical protein EDB85DRAFT_1893361 [Lactarius pseudohatsudake]|nr:hypothetical protein EDB85DRAFT_1893361 [Lactarius pseudohatsudake]